MHKAPVVVFTSFRFAARFLRSGVACLALVIIMGEADPVLAQSNFLNNQNTPESQASAPPMLSTLQNTVKQDDGPAGNMSDEDETSFNLEKQAMREAALSLGARGGLAWRTYHIRQTLEHRSDYLDRTFNFRQLLIPAPSGLLIEPPIISEATNALIVENNGQEAAVADRIYNINANARIVTAPRDWRSYLEREWGEVDPPPDVLRPETREERKIWARNVEQGWREGVSQADAIFNEDLNRLTRDYEGMIRYRQLLAQGIVSPPFALQVDRGITGGGAEMRVGDRAVSITGPSQLQTSFETWQPASR